ncbi:class I SAM-dependent methyltransferase [Paenibacillus senegalensis]|uniref:class I SAM-dependent methyltransferase n=1 Tax=Paenibacillus senegalensis TaxID=1465766 RepID=UPI000289D591|nr:class I SAM-dependent methyltransferase [Paenibacillus senegalensis]
MNSQNQWNPDVYDQKLSFVSGYGEDVLQWLAPKAGERIVDLGCGTGVLSEQIRLAGAHIIGIDYSKEMILKAKAKYPDIMFIVDNAYTFQLDSQVDAVFSNAALHWMNQPAKAAASIWNALKPGGRFVAEFGGAGNVETIVQSLSEVLSEDFGLDAASRNPWYFPSIGAYCSLLEQTGFQVKLAHHFDRPTRLPDGEAGVDTWLKNLAGDFFVGFTSEQIDRAVQRTRSLVVSKLWKEDAVYADYKRLRIAAYKPQF